jgi:RNA recognition motif-containing protein
VNYLPISANSGSFRKLVSKYGNIINCKLICSKSIFSFIILLLCLGGTNLGYGFVEYASALEALTAINGLNGMLYDGKRLKISYARNPSLDIKNANMYVSGLHPSIDKDCLYKLFEPYGRIITHNILKG